MQIKVLKEHPEAKLPSKTHKHDHCWDFFACEDTILVPGETNIIDLGIKMELPAGYAMILKERSGLALKGLIIGGGVIDELYRGSIKVIARYMPRTVKKSVEGRINGIYETSYGYFFDKTLAPDAFTFKIKAGDKIAQGKLEKTLDADIIEIQKDSFISQTERADKGFGSTDQDRLNAFQTKPQTNDPNLY